MESHNKSNTINQKRGNAASRIAQGAVKSLPKIVKSVSVHTSVASGSPVLVNPQTAIRQESLANKLRNN